MSYCPVTVWGRYIYYYLLIIIYTKNPILSRLFCPRSRHKPPMCDMVTKGRQFAFVTAKTVHYTASIALYPLHKPTSHFMVAIKPAVLL